MRYLSGNLKKKKIMTKNREKTIQPFRQDGGRIELFCLRKRQLVLMTD